MYTYDLVCQKPEDYFACAISRQDGTNDARARIMAWNLPVIKAGSYTYLHEISGFLPGSHFPTASNGFGVRTEGGTRACKPHLEFPFT